MTTKHKIRTDTARLNWLEETQLELMNNFNEDTEKLEWYVANRPYGTREIAFTVRQAIDNEMSFEESAEVKP